MKKFFHTLVSLSVLALMSMAAFAKVEPNCNGRNLKRKHERVCEVQIQKLSIEILRASALIVDANLNQKLKVLEKGKCGNGSALLDLLGQYDRLQKTFEIIENEGYITPSAIEGHVITVKLLNQQLELLIKAIKAE